MDIVERLRDMQGKKYQPDWSEWVQTQCSEAAKEIERLRSVASAYDALLRANGPAWLQRVSFCSYSDAMADCKRAGWRLDPSNGWPDTDTERSAGG